MHKIEECRRKPTGDFVLYRPQCCDYTKKRIILWFRSMTSIISTPTWWSVQESHFRCTPGTSILTSTDAHPLEHHDCETRFLRYSNGKGREGKGRAGDGVIFCVFHLIAPPCHQESDDKRPIWLFWWERLRTTCKSFEWDSRSKKSHCLTWPDPDLNPMQRCVQERIVPLECKI